jgi:TRAP-type transport system small permease protein
MLFRVLDRTLEILLFLVLAAMGAIVAANVFCRFVLDFSLYWGDEAAQALLVWLTFLGAAVAVRDRAHYSFDYLARTSTGKRRLVLGVISRSITILALLGLLYWSLEVAWGIRPWIMPAMEISRVWVYAAGPVGCAFMLLYAVRDLARVIRSGGAEDEPVAAV